MSEIIESAVARAPPPSKSSSAYNHPPYPIMIFSAIKALNDRKGSSRRAISEFISTAFLELPPSHPALLERHLRRMKEKGRLISTRRCYRIPKKKAVKKNPANPGEKRGRGRPRKQQLLMGPEAGEAEKKIPLLLAPAAGEAEMKRSRGRPRKVAEGVSSALVALDPMTEAVPVVLTEAVPAALPESVPVELPESVPAALPESAPAELPESMPAALSESAPAALSESAPEALPEKVERRGRPSKKVQMDVAGSGDGVAPPVAKEKPHVKKGKVENDGAEEETKRPLGRPRKIPLA